MIMIIMIIDRHTETLVWKARSLLHNISGEFSRLPSDRILCHGAHDEAKNLADQASGTGRSSEFFAGWLKILDGHPGPFWVSSFVCGGSRAPVRPLRGYYYYSYHYYYY